MSTLCPELELTALLHEAHNCCFEVLETAPPGVIPSAEPRPLSLRPTIPPRVLAGLNSLAPKATKAACTLLDDNAHVDAVWSEAALAFVVGGHVALVGGFYVRSSPPSLAPVSGRVHHSCDCGAYAFRGERFCKHIIAAGLSAAMGTARVRDTPADELAKLLDHSIAAGQTVRNSGQD